MSNIYYLVASLPDIMLEVKKNDFNMHLLFDFCEENLSTAEYKNMKSLFYFGDIKNAVGSKKEDYKFIFPAFYTEEEFKENYKNTDDFCSFLSEYYFNQKNNIRIYPELTETDELTLLMYNSLENMTKNSYILGFYKNELCLRNFTTALSSRKLGQNYEDRIIPFGDFADEVKKSPLPDFGLTGEFPYLEKLITSYNEGNIFHIEEVIESIRFGFLDDLSNGFSFTPEFVYSVAVKLSTTERWQMFGKDKGREKLENIIEHIRNSINFPQEFSKIGNRKK